MKTKSVFYTACVQEDNLKLIVAVAIYSSIGWKIKFSDQGKKLRLCQKERGWQMRDSLELNLILSVFTLVV